MSKFINDVNLNQNELQNAVIQPLSTAPANPKVGQVYFDTTDNNIYRWDGTEWKTYQSALDTTATSTLGIDSAPAAGSNNLVTSGGVYSAVNNVLPSQAGQSGKYLTTNGTSASWATVESGDSLPDQTGQAGKFLTTDGTDASWENVPSYSFSNGLTESSSTVYNTGVLNVEASPSTASNGTVAVIKGTSEGETSTSYVAVKGLGSAAYTDSSAYLPSSTTIPTAYTSNPAMDGTASPGSSSAYAKGDHVHPSDTSKQATITASGILKGDGSGGVTAATAETDYVAPSALSDYMQKGVDYVTAGQKANTTLGTQATVEGDNNTASGAYSHAEGKTTQATGNYSHAEGEGTIASKNHAHAEGNGVQASGTDSHAEGNGTVASGDTSHAEGCLTTASGTYAHAEGRNTTANHKSQHVFGEYNVLDANAAAVTARGDYVEIVGNGTAANARSNARTLDWSGNEVLAGKLTVGAGPTNNMDVATKQYVDGVIPSVPTGSSTSPKMDGTAAAGTETTWAHGDHVHPTDTTRQAKITASGILKGNGSGTISAAVAGTDYQAPITNPITGTGQNKYLAKFNGTNSITSGPELIAAGDGTYLAHDGLWADPLPSRTGNSGKFLTTNGTAVSWANVSGVEYFTIISGVTEWTDFSATTFYNCYTSGKMPVVIDGDNGNIHFYPMSIASDSCIFEGITDIGDTGNVYCTYCVLFAYEDSSDNYIDTYSIGSGSSVSYTPTLSSGTKVGTITIDGTDNDIYAPTNTDVDVTQTKATYSTYTYWRPVTVGSSTNSSVTGAFSTTTNGEYAFDNLRYQPSTGTLRTKVYNVSPTEAGTTASNNQMTSDSTNNIYFKVNNGTDTIMTLYSNGTDMQVRPGGQYDNQVDLGKSTVRWKNAYLSGTVNAADYAGDITATTTVASGDKIIVHDASASNVAGGITLGSSTTQYLANDGSWQNIPSSGTQVSLVDWTV